MTKRPLTQMAAASMMLAGLLIYSSTATAASLTYNSTANAGWFTADAWNGPSTWTSGDSATINNPGAALVINFNSSTTVSDLSVSGAQGTSINSTTAQSLTFNGGTLHVATPQGFQTTGGVSLQGNFQFSSASGGFLRISSSAIAAAYSGTATVTGGRLEWSAGTNVGLNSHFVVNGGVVQNRDVTSSIGSITLNSGSFELGRNNTNGTSATTTLASLSGTGGSIVTPARIGNLSLSLVRTLTVNQSVDTTFEGAILGVNEGARITFNKQGAGSLALSGTINLARQTSITGGKLYINGANATFTNEQEVDGTAINVDGGTLGGTGTLTISGGDKVVLSSSGSLAAGEEDAFGRTTYNFTDGGELDLSAATAGSATGWLKFDLGADITAGTTYDQISLTEGTLNIGTGLSFSDFAFSLQSGFAPGSYTLFSTVDGIFGSLGTAEGFLGGYESTLQLSGNDLVLTVVPEPATVSLLFGSGVLLLAAGWRKRKSL